MSAKPLFTSARERRLWLWTLVVVVGIYSTLGLAATLAGALDQGLSTAVFLTGMFLVGVTILTQGLKARPGGKEIGIALGLAVVYLFVFFRMTVPERTHLIEYSVVAVFIHEALTERIGNGRHIPVPGLVAVLATSLFGAIDEFIQLFLPSRVFDPRDILFNVLAAAMAVTASVALAWARRWRLKHVAN